MHGQVSPYASQIFQQRIRGRRGTQRKVQNLLSKIVWIFKKEPKRGVEHSIIQFFKDRQMSVFTGHQVLLTTTGHFTSGKRVFSCFFTELNALKRVSRVVIIQCIDYISCLKGWETKEAISNKTWLCLKVVFTMT